jgi:hypothetical protein
MKTVSGEIAGDRGSVQLRATRKDEHRGKAALAGSNAGFCSDKREEINEAAFLTGTPPLRLCGG